MLSLFILFPLLISGLLNKINPLSDYEFSWTADVVTQKLSIQIKLTPSGGKTVGWVGFGIAGGAGGMLGADVMTAYSTGSSTCTIDDRSAASSEKVMPAVDTTVNGFADWTLDSCSMAGGVFTVSATRAFVTFDSLDRDFVTGPMELVFAWGQAQPTSSNLLTYHDGGYVPKHVSLWGEAVEVFDKATLEAHDISFVNMTNVDIGPGNTYLCQGFNLTQKDTKPTQAIAFEPIVAPIANEPYVHHMVLYICDNPVSSSVFECTNMPSACQGILYAWGKGGGPFVLPRVTGVQIGSPGRVYVALQMHYYNAAGTPSIKDASGVNIYRTNAIRQSQSGMFLLGTSNIALPARQSDYTISAECPATLTALLPVEGVVAYASFMHAHQRGRRIWTEVVRNGVRIATIGNNQNYDFNLQKVQSLSPTVTLLRGDVFNTFCSYNTSTDTTIVRYGEQTGNEMCFNFVAYYRLLGSNPTYPCWNPQDSSAPGATSCSLLPGHPPAAYTVTDFIANKRMYTGGKNASCSEGFEGIATVSCAGNGAPFTFSGCTRKRRDEDANPQLGSAVGVALPVSVFLLLLCLSN